jgi:ribulose-5-phosphate 4-epimerase/fuculose-1-phosphate aldolase
MSREPARALARARTALRAAIVVHKRTIAAHRRSLREAARQLEELEEACEAQGITLVIDEENDTAQSKEDAAE